jgi:hypothetical protein
MVRASTSGSLAIQLFDRGNNSRKAFSSIANRRKRMKKRHKENLDTDFKVAIVDLLETKWSRCMGGETRSEKQIKKEDYIQDPRGYVKAKKAKEKIFRNSIFGEINKNRYDLEVGSENLVVGRVKKMAPISPPVREIITGNYSYFGNYGWGELDGILSYQSDDDDEVILLKPQKKQKFSYTVP